MLLSECFLKLCAQMQHIVLTLTFGWWLIYLGYLSFLGAQSSPGLSFFLSVLLAGLMHNFCFY